MSQAVLEAKGITKRYGGVTALDDVSIAIRRGEVLCLAGTNGCGKSTLIKILSGVEHPSEGRVLLDGADVTGLGALDAIRLGIQVIFQDMSVFPNLTVAENICFGERVAEGRRTRQPRIDHETAKRVLNELGVEMDLDAELKDLTVADRQIVAIARALARDVKVLFMDEPTTALTWKEVQVLFGIVAKLRDQGVAIVFVSHKTDEVLSVSDRIVVMRNGKVVADSPSDRFTPDLLAESLLGYVATEERRVSALAPDEPEVLSVDSLSAHRLFEDVSFHVKKGEIVGITGLLGSGRSEIAEAVVGKIRTDRGSVSVGGEVVRFRGSAAALDAGIAYVPPDRLTQGVFLKQSILNNVIASTLASLSSALGWIRWNRARELVDQQIEELGIKVGSPKDPVSSLSGGNQQKVVLAKCFATNPRVLILNGPTVGVDIGAKATIMDILREHAASGMGVLLISDDIPELVSVCHRVLVMRRGRLVDELAGDEVTTDRVEEVFQAE
ncbi:MAG: sugar ABC transporter ATP-binding protein [Schaalia turicensis]|nr:sugar ABC transporter ATP-binding protein [Schaalia turicensis]